MRSLTTLLIVVTVSHLCFSVVHGQFDSALAPFSYDTLETLEAPNPYSPPVLLETAPTAAAVAFPFEQPPLPADLAAKIEAQNPAKAQSSFVEANAGVNRREPTENDGFELDDGPAAQLQSPVDTQKQEQPEQEQNSIEPQLQQQQAQPTQQYDQQAPPQYSQQAELPQYNQQSAPPQQNDQQQQATPQYSQQAELPQYNQQSAPPQQYDQQAPPQYSQQAELPQYGQQSAAPQQFDQQQQQPGGDMRFRNTQEQQQQQEGPIVPSTATIPLPQNFVNNGLGSAGSIGSSSFGSNNAHQGTISIIGNSGSSGSLGSAGSLGRLGGGGGVGGVSFGGVNLPPLPSIPNFPTSSSASYPTESQASSSQHEQSPEYYKCIGSGRKHGDCVIRYPPGAISWHAKFVPKVENAQPQSNVIPYGAAQSGSGASSGAALSSSDPPEIDVEFSANPEIAKLQHKYVDRYRELQKEKRWLNDVNEILADYKRKIEKVRHHSIIEASSLEKFRKHIAHMITQDKQDRLETELHAALDGLKRLEQTSSTLTGQVHEVSSEKQHLRQTIGKIQAALGKVPTADINAALPRFRQKIEANDDAKKIFANLLELLTNKQHEHEEVAKKVEQPNKLKYGTGDFEAAFERTVEEADRGLE